MLSNYKIYWSEDYLNDHEIKEVGGIKGIKYRYEKPFLVFKVKIENLPDIRTIIQELLIDEFTTILFNDKEKFSLLDIKKINIIKLQMVQDEDWVKNLFFYKVSPFLPDSFFLEKEVKRKKEILW